MSVDPSRLIGRIAKVVGLLNKPSLNNALVVVENFDPTNYRYGCKNLYISSSSPDSVSLRRHNLDFVSPIFEMLHSNAPTVSGYDFHCAPAGTILDFSQCNSEPCSDIPLIFDKAFSVRGSKRTPTRPMTVVRHLVIVATECDEVIEFEDINFDIANGAVICRKGKSITFRRCFFKAKFAAVQIWNEGTRVIFEKCTFADFPYYGVIVGPKTHALFVDCYFTNLHGALEVQEGASAEILYCFISKVKVGCHVHSRDSSLALKHSMILSCADCGVFISTGGKGIVDNCQFQGDKGVIVQGPKRSSLRITETSFCGTVGITVQLGKSDVFVESVHIRACMVGILIAKDAVGTVHINNVTIYKGGGDIRNHGGINSTVIRDGAVMPRDGLMMNIGRFFGVGGRTLVSEKSFDDVSPLVVARVRKRAGLGVVTCEACGAEEPTETEFRKCGACKSCCYCSRDCQVKTASYY